MATQSSIHVDSASGRIGRRMICLPALMIAFATLATESALTQEATFESFSYSQRPALGFCPELASVFSAQLIRDTSSGRENQYTFSLSVLRRGIEGIDECVDIVDRNDCFKVVQLDSRALLPDEVSTFLDVVPQLINDEREPNPDPQCGSADPCRIREFSLDDVTLSTDPCSGPRLTEEQAQSIVDILDGFNSELAEVQNGDTNSDGLRDLSDAIFLLQHLFVGGPKPEQATCSPFLDCDPIAIERVHENGDINGDKAIDVSDPIRLLMWLFGSAPPPAPACVCKSQLACDDCAAPARCLPGTADEFVCTDNLETCNQVANLYDFLVDSFSQCGGDACHVLAGHCTVGLGGCHYGVTTALEQADLNELAARWVDLGCFDPADPICECPAPPETVGCSESNICELGF